MLRPLAAAVLLSALMVFGSATGSSAQTVPGPQSAAPPAYWPGLGDLMTMTVQPRHIKLALAGREQNWAYAAYELHELEEALERAARAWPQWRKNPIADLMGSVTNEPMAMLSKAIKSADAEQFNVAYKRLTDSCNACHHAANVGFNVIVVPNASAFPDQDFRPVKP